MESNYKHVIIGAGPSGMACALSLLKKGEEPLVLEKKKFPRSKTCGGLVTEKTNRLVQALLSEYGETEALYCNQTTQASVYQKTEKLSQASFQTPVRFVRRETFDHALVQTYQTLGGTILESCGAYTVDYPNNRIFLSDGRTIRYQNLIFADGALSQARKRVSPEEEKLVFGLEVFLPAEQIPVKDVRLYFGYIDCGYLWVFPYGDTVSVGVAANYRKGLDYKKSLTAFLKEQAIETKGLRFEGAFLPAGIPTPQEKLEPNVICVGDAAGLADPLSGEGLYFALLSGMAAAKALLGGSDPKRAYLDKMQPVFRLLSEGCRLQQRFYNPSVQRWFIRHARGNNEFLPFFFERMVSRYEYSYGKPAGIYLDYKRRKANKTRG